MSCNHPNHTSPSPTTALPSPALSLSILTYNIKNSTCISHRNYHIYIGYQNKLTDRLMTTTLLHTLHMPRSKSERNIIILQVKINGIKNKIKEVKLLIYKTHADTITIQETKLTPEAKTEVPNISAYTWCNRQATMTPANRDHLYPDSLLFVSAGFLTWVRLQRLNGSSFRSQSRYDEDRTEPNFCSFRWLATYIQIQALLPSTPVLYVPETSLVEE